VNSAGLTRGASVKKERHAGDKLASFEPSNSGASGAYLAAQRHADIALRRNLGAALAARPGARVDRHRRVQQAGQYHVGTNIRGRCPPTKLRPTAFGPTALA
jgi:hypothetical protein